MQALLDFLKSLGAARIAAMCAVTVALVGFFAFLILHVTAPQMTPLFTDLSLEDSTAIVKELERQGIAYELRDDGAIVLAPKDRVPRLRMSLAESGLPKGGGVGYEIFDKSEALGRSPPPPSPPEQAAFSIRSGARPEGAIISQLIR